MFPFGGMKLYTVHIRPGTAGAGERPVFIKEGFNLYAFLLTFFWALYHRLWLPFFLILAFNIFLSLLLRTQLFMPASVAAIQLGFQLLVGWQANDWRRSRLSRRGYIIADIAAADSELRAEQRYFERHLAGVPG